MGMVIALHGVSDVNIVKILEFPELIWKLIAADDPDAYYEAIQERSKVGFFAKLFGKKSNLPTDIPDLILGEGENIEEDLDKSWQGIHYCLNKTAFKAEPPMDFIIVGGELAGDIDVGYGPARLFRRSVVKAIADRLTDITIEDLRANYNPKAMEELDIYPNIWESESDEGFDYIAEYFDVLKSFISECTKHNLGMVVYII